MLHNLLFSLNTVLPLLIMMSVGYFFRRWKMMDEHFIKQGNNLVFRFFLPVLVCKNIMEAGQPDKSAAPVFIYIIISVTVMFLLLFLLIPRFEKENSKRGVMIQAIGRSNYALFGLPLVSLLFPNEDVSIASLLVLAAVPLFNGFSTIALEVFHSFDSSVIETSSPRESYDPDSSRRFPNRFPLRIIRNILLNPLILSSMLGFLFLKLDLSFPPVIDHVVTQFSRVATPLALFLLGGSFEASKIFENKKQLTVSILGKLLIVPIIFVTLAVILGFRGPNLAAILITFAAPASASSYTMAHQMGGDSELAAEHIVFSSVFSIPTVFLFIFVLKSLNFL